MPFFDDIMKMLRTEGPVNWDLTRQFAQWATTEGQPESNVDPIHRIRLGELLRVAELHVSDATGLPTGLPGGLLTVRPVPKAEWARAALDDWKPLLEGLADSLGNPKKMTGGGTDPADLSGLSGLSEALAEQREGEPDMSGLLGELTSFIGPLFMSIQIGGMAGHLAHRALGRHDPPPPPPPSPQLLSRP